RAGASPLAPDVLDRDATPGRRLGMGGRLPRSAGSRRGRDAACYSGRGAGGDDLAGVWCCARQCGGRCPAVPSQLLAGSVEAAPWLTPPAAGCEPRESLERDSGVGSVGGALGGVGPGALLATARDFFECPADAVDELAATVRRLAAATPAEVEAAIPERLEAWLPAHVRHAGARRALLLMATVIFHPHPEEASVGRLMEFLQRPRSGPFVPDDDEAGGMQGLMEPWARAIRARGGEIALGWKPVEIVVEGGAVRGAVAVDRTNLVREVRAAAVIPAYPVLADFGLIDARLSPPDF